ncbi:MAG: hypothetical protein JWP72_841, partial [Massilia sp.]|nr:hypothetical protein [Massilia sp.]
GLRGSPLALTEAPAEPGRRAPAAFFMGCPLALPDTRLL